LSNQPAHGDLHAASRRSIPSEVKELPCDCKHDIGGAFK
jgi:hypothetical protein